MNEKEIEHLKKENKELRKEIERLKNVKENQKKGMANKARKGNLMSRSPFGYKILNKKLVPAENSREIEEIFEEFLEKKVTLTKLAKKT